MTAEWTLLVYMAGDSNLFEETSDDLNRMTVADSRLVRVAIQRDRPNANTERLEAGDGRLDVRELNHNVNFGRPESLAEFLAWGRLNVPAANQLVVVYSHGNGWLDFPQQLLSARRNTTRVDVKERHRKDRLMFYSAVTQSIGDDATSGDFLDIEEFAIGLSAARLPIIGCDACYMGMVEVAHQIRNAGMILVASEDREETEGWPYDEILRRFRSGLSAEDVATLLVEEFGKAYAHRPSAVLAAIRLDAITALASALDNLGGLLQPLTGTPTSLRTIVDARRNTFKCKQYVYIDLADFAEQVATRFPATAIEEAARAVITAVDAAVLKRSNPSRPSAQRGIAIYLPNGPVHTDYHALSLSAAAPRWHDFVVDYGRLRRTAG